MHRPLAILAIALTAGFAAAAPPDPAPRAGTVPAATLSPPAGALVAPGAAPDLIFLFTGDVIGYVEPCG